MNVYRMAVTAKILALVALHLYRPDAVYIAAVAIIAGVSLIPSAIRRVHTVYNGPPSRTVHL